MGQETWYVMVYQPQLGAEGQVSIDYL